LNFRDALRIIDLKRQHEDIEDELNIKVKKCQQIETNINQYKEECQKLKNEYEPIEIQYRKVEENLDQSRNQLVKDEQNLKTALNKLQDVLRSLNEAEQKLRQQQQQILTIQLELFERLQEEQTLNQDRKKAEIDRKELFEKLKIDLQNRSESLPTCISDYEQAKTNRTQLETTLSNSEQNILQKKQEIDNQWKQFKAIQNDVHRYQAILCQTKTQHEVEKNVYKKLQEEKQEKLKEILSKKRDIQLEEQKQQFLKKNIQQLETKRNGYCLLIADIQKRFKDLKQKIEKDLDQYKDLNDDDFRPIDFDQQNQHEILLLRREDDDLKEKEETLEELSQLITKDAKQLQPILAEHKRLHDNTKQNISQLEQSLSSLKIEKEFCEKDVEESKVNQRKIHLALKMKLKELMNKKLELELYALTSIQYKAQSTLIKSQDEQYQKHMSSLNELYEKKQNQYRDVETIIKNTEKEINEIYRSMNDTENAIRSAREQISYKETSISILNDLIFELRQEFSKVQLEFNANCDKFKTFYEKLMSFECPLASIQQEIFQKQSEINLLNHQIALKEDEIRNYIEVQNRYTVDQY
jgi:chromosome segregation ATPase